MTRAPLVAAVLAALGVATVVAVAQTPVDPRRSGSRDMGEDLRAMQADDTANPGMLAVVEGEALWNRPAGATAKSCADCHGAPAAMSGVATRHPAFHAASGKPLALDQRIDLCRVEKQGAERFGPENRQLLALTALVARQSRGQPIAPPEDPRLRPFADAGAAFFGRRQGQLNLSCANCHDDNAGRKLGGATIPQGHPDGYPLYRLEWQAVGSLRRRLRNCLVGMRAEAWGYDAPEYVELELFLMDRARGMPLQSPGVRP